MTGWERVRAHLRANWELDVALLGVLSALVTSALGVTSVKALLVPMQATLGAVSLGMIRDRLRDRTADRSLQEISAAVRTLAEDKIFDQDDKPYKELIRYVSEHEVREAVFLQYSAARSKDVLKAVLGKGAKADVYIQHGDMAAKIGSEMQADRIAGSIRNNLPYLNGRLTVYRCVPPVSVRAIRIDDRVLCMGWYTYETEPGRKDFPNDTTAVSGHDRATIIAWKGTSDYEALNSTLNVLLANYLAHREEVPL
jgi:hypothetical protein